MFEKLVATFFLVVVGCGYAAAQDAVGASTEELDRWVSAYTDAAGPGLSVLVQRGDEKLLYEGYGLASIEHGVAATPETVYRIGSITKQFTGAAVAMLAEQGKLSIDDPITKFLPDYPTHGHVITVRHLLHHTSGIKSYTGVPGWVEEKIQLDLTTSELVDAFKSYPMDFGPGERFLYNNSGYVLLGAIIEDVSEMSYAEFIEQNISEPLGLANTRYEDRSIVPNMARGYTSEGGTILRARYLSVTQPHAAGMLTSTVDELAKWTVALASGSVVSAESYQQMITPTLLNDGTEYPYGFGLRINDVRGRVAIAHAGGIHGGQSYGLHIPDENVIVVLLTNNDAFKPMLEYIGVNLAAMAIGDPYHEPVPVTLNRAERNGLAGTFANASYGDLEIWFDGADAKARAVFGEWDLQPVSVTEFAVQDSFWRVEVATDSDGQRTTNLYTDATSPPMIFTEKE